MYVSDTWSGKTFRDHPRCTGLDGLEMSLQTVNLCFVFDGLEKPFETFQTACLTNKLIQIHSVFYSPFFAIWSFLQTIAFTSCIHCFSIITSQMRRTELPPFPFRKILGLNIWECTPISLYVGLWDHMFVLNDTNNYPNFYHHLWRHEGLTETTFLL